MKRKVAIGVILGALIGVTIAYFVIKIPDFEPVVRKFQISTPNAVEPIYVTAKNWGVSYDHQMILISTGKKEGVMYDPETDIKYDGLSPLFSKFSGDTLQLFVRVASKIPDNFYAKVPIRQFILTNVEMQRLVRNYKRLGYTRLDRME